MRRIVSFLSLLLALLGAVALHVVRADDQNALRPIRLHWALAALPAGAAAPTAVRADTALVSGTRLRLLIEPGPDTWAYVLLQDASGQVQRLYPQTLGQQSTSRQYLPPDDNWFVLDKQKGSETFFLLASAERLIDLERLLAAHDSAEAQREASATAVIDEIRRHFRQHRAAASGAERPANIGGQTKGEVAETMSIDHLALEVTAPGFYRKTITIDH